MDQQPKIPTLKDSQKPQVKVRGLGAGLTLGERLKQFKKKDLAFILAGLGVLFMAPLAEHFMMAPESADGTLQQGWGSRSSSDGSGSAAFGAGGSPYERSDGLAPGGPTGGGSDVITPLNVRDPSALVMGSGATQQPPTNSALPQTPPSSSSRSDSDLKDALASAAARGAGAAAKRASLPVPKVAIGGSGLRGLSAASGGGSSATASLAAPSSAGVPNKASMSDSTSRAHADKDYHGVARGQTQGGTGIEALKAAANKQGESYNRSGSASSDLTSSANTAIPGGGGSSTGGSGGPAGGKDDKGPGGNQDKNSKTTGESLAYQEKKLRMEKDLEIEYEKKKQNDMGLLFGKIRNDFMTSAASEIGKAMLNGVIIDPMKKQFGREGAKSVWKCGDIKIQGDAVGAWGSKCERGIQFILGSNGKDLYSCGAGEQPDTKDAAYKGCTNIKGEDAVKEEGKDKQTENIDSAGSKMSSGDVSKLGPACKKIKDMIGGLSAKPAAAKPAAGAEGAAPATSGVDTMPGTTDLIAAGKEALEAAALLVQVRDSLAKQKDATVDCERQAPVADPPITDQQNTIISGLAGDKGLLPQMVAVVPKLEKDGSINSGTETQVKNIGKAQDELDKAKGILTKAQAGAQKAAAVPSTQSKALALIYDSRKSEDLKDIKGSFETIGKSYTAIDEAMKTYTEVQDNLTKKHKSRVSDAGKSGGTVDEVVKTNKYYSDAVDKYPFKDDATRQEFASVLVPIKSPSASANAESKTAATTKKIEMANKAIAAASESLSAYEKAKEDAAYALKMKTEATTRLANNKDPQQVATLEADLQTKTLSSDKLEAARKTQFEKTKESIKSANKEVGQTQEVQVGEANNLKEAVNKDGDTLKGAKKSDDAGMAASMANMAH